LAHTLHYLKQTLCLHCSCLHYAYGVSNWLVHLQIYRFFFLQNYEHLLGNVIEPESPEDGPTVSKHVGRSVKGYNGNEVGLVDGVRWIITVVYNVCISAYSTAGNVRIA